MHTFYSVRVNPWQEQARGMLEETVTWTGTFFHQKL